MSKNFFPEVDMSTTINPSPRQEIENAAQSGELVVLSDAENLTVS